MASSYTPSVNLHSPGPIGDVTPSSLAGTTLALTSSSTQIQITNSPTVATATCDVFGDITHNISGGNNFHLFNVNGSTVLFVGPNLFGASNGAVFKLGNNASTGLVAGVLSALTNASIVISDATGQAYRVPCII